MVEMSTNTNISNSPDSTGGTDGTGGPGSPGVSGIAASDLASLKAMLGQLVGAGKNTNDPNTQGQIQSLEQQIDDEKTYIDNNPIANPEEATTDAATIKLLQQAVQQLTHPTLSPNSVTNPAVAASPGGAKKFQGNLWLSGLVAVVLATVMMKLTQFEKLREKTDQSLWSSTMLQLQDLAQNMAANIIASAQTQANSEKTQGMSQIIGGALTIAGGVLGGVLGAGGKSKSEIEGEMDDEMEKDATTGIDKKKWDKTADQEAFNEEVNSRYNAGQQAAQNRANTVSQILKGVGDVVTGSASMIQAGYTVEKGQLDAAKEIMENVKMQLNAILQKIQDDQKDSNSELANAIQMFQNWMDNLSKAFGSLTGH